MSKLNSKTLTIAAGVLVVLALLFMATPLLRVSGLTGQAGFNRQFNGQANPNGGNGTAPFNGQNDFPSFGNGGTGQGNTTNPTARQFPAQSRSLLGLGLLSGITGTIFYLIALLVSLAAAIGMFITKRWGQVLGIVMAVLYLILSLVTFLPTILLGFARGFNVLSVGLTILHVVLAIAVIVLALIPARKILAPAVPGAPVEPSAPATPPVASA
jgi:hypothetical protein